MTHDAPLLLVDGHHLLWRGAFGFPAPIFSRDKTRELTAEFAFFALLRVAVREEFASPPEIIVVFDGQHGAAERQSADGDYKANRVVDEAALKPIRAIPHVQEALTIYELAWIEIDTAEADDVIATLVTNVRRDEPGRKAWIMSGDRDFYQLVDEHVVVLNTAMKRGTRHIGPEAVRSRFQVDPAQWADFRALTGDPADNIAGVKGIGTNTAAKLLAGGITLEHLHASGRLVGAKGAAVDRAWKDVLAWRDLIRMRTDLDLPTRPTGRPSPALPRPADVIEKLGLW